MASVTLDNISKTFPGGTRAVQDVSLEIADGEFIVLVGPSGCGKSTTLRLIAGLEDLTEGSIRIGDRVVNRVHPKDRDIAMVFQNYALYPHMTVYRNMAFALRLRKVPRAEIERRVREAAELLGMTDLLNRKPHALSGGQRQRVAVGRAIVREPACFLFDEPLSNLDVKLRVQMRAELKALHLRLKTTAIYVTHDQEEAMTLGDRIAVMADGRLQQVAPPLEVYRKPVNRFVAGFVGMPPMNFITGTVRRTDSGLSLVDLHGSTLPIAAPLAETAAAYEGRELVAGVRPESIRLHRRDSEENAGTNLRATVRVTEPLGDRLDVFLALPGGQSVVARVAWDCAVSVGEEILLGVEPASLHLFETGEFGRHILYGQTIDS